MSLHPDARALIEGPNFAHLATLLPSGAPHTVPLWVDMEGERVVFFAQPTSQKGRNVARDPRVAQVMAGLASEQPAIWTSCRIFRQFRKRHSLTLAQCPGHTTSTARRACNKQGETRCRRYR